MAVYKNDTPDRIFTSESNALAEYTFFITPWIDVGARVMQSNGYSADGHFLYANDLYNQGQRPVLCLNNL